jgi:hypothetical protein
MREKAERRRGNTKLPSGKGLWPAHWLLSDYCWPIGGMLERKKEREGRRVRVRDESRGERKRRGEETTPSFCLAKDCGLLIGSFLITVGPLEV